MFACVDNWDDEKFEPLLLRNIGIIWRGGGGGGGGGGGLGEVG